MVAAVGGDAATTEPDGSRRADRRARRRQETIDEILDIAIEVMSERGVNGLTLAEVARRLGVQPPSIYKYFSSIGAVYDALFERAASENLTVLRDAMARGEPGLDALTTGLEASGRRDLYVSLTRTTDRLTVVGPVPAGRQPAGAS